MDAEDTRYVSVRELAKLLGTNRRRIYYLITKGDVPVVNVAGRMLVRESVVDLLVKRPAKEA